MYYTILNKIIVGGKSWITKLKVEHVLIIALRVEIMLEIIEILVEIKTIIQTQIQIQTVKDGLLSSFLIVARIKFIIIIF